jgi:hypothetical protein
MNKRASLGPARPHKVLQQIPTESGSPSFCLSAMRFLLLVFCLFVPKLVRGSAEEDRSAVVVRARIAKKPISFVFPGCRCEHRPSKPHKAHVSELELIIPGKLKGKRLSLYHLPALRGRTIWHQVDSIVEFRIDQQSLGSLYPQTHPRGSFIIPYASDIIGEARIIQMPGRLLRPGRSLSLGRQTFSRISREQNPDRANPR